MEHVLQEVIRTITEIFHFIATRVFLFDPRGDNLYLRASFEIKPGPLTRIKIFQAGQGITGRVAHTGEPIIIENVQGDPRYRKLSHFKTATKAGIKFIAVFPIKTRVRTVGTINCLGQDSCHLAPDEIKLLAFMADHIAIALENARLNEKAKEQKEQHVKDIIKRKRVEKKITRSLDRLRSLSSHLEIVREDERDRIASAIHDDWVE